VAGLIKGFYVMVKNTHRHPVNRILHAFGLLFYLAGIGSVIGHPAGYNSPLQGAVFCLVAISAFILGHKIEGNLAAITPVLAYRLVARKLRGYLGTDRIHVQSA
jgi:hypothetical protein